MLIRCHRCSKTLMLPTDGALPAQCPHCTEAPGPGPLGAYEPLRLLAAGGMGEVYLARHRELGTEVAIKLLPPVPLNLQPGLRERFAREARLTSQVVHPGVVRVLASEMAEDRPFLVLELVRGRTLRALLADGQMSSVEALRIAVATAEVLAAAHRHGVLHRDVKPDNVMVQDDGQVRVLDFGIARAVADDAPLTRTGELVGTPEYMAPEQLLEGPEAVDARTDVHALGVLTYELLTGRSPFRGNNLFQALKLVESLSPPPPSSLRRGVPPAVDAVVRRALHKDPRQRPADAAEFAQELRRAMPQQASRARATHLATRSFVAGLALVIMGALAVKPWLASSAEAPLDAERLLDERRVTERTEIELDLASGRWHRALHRAERLRNEGDFGAELLAQEAFVLQHASWPLLLSLPVWLSSCDERQRRRLFLDDVEVVRGDPNDASQLLGTPLPPALAARRRLTWLTTARGDGVIPLEASEPSASDSLLPVLQARSLGADALADALHAHARRLPIDEPEHWLAELAARHLRGDAVGREQAAEQAWLCGAGELAVLLDAAVTTLPLGSTSAALVRERDESIARRTRRRVLAAIDDDTPAAVLLHTAMAALADETPQLAALRRLPRSFAGVATKWLVSTAAADAGARDQLLQAAVSLGTPPDYSKPPWSAVGAERRRVLDAEVQRGR